MNETLIIYGLGAVVLVTMLFVLLPSFAGNSRNVKRKKMVAATVNDKKLAGRKARGKEQRRKSVQEALKFQDNRAKGRVKNVPLRKQLVHAGWKMSVRGFWLMSIICGVVVCALVIAVGLAPIMAIGPALCAAYLLPRFFLSRAKKKREKKFLEEFPNAIDTIVRGIKSGLPLNDSMRVVANDAKEPVRTEFSLILDEQRMGTTSAEAVENLFDRLPISEVNFFSVVISVQQQSGGNLAEALSNLSKVLRDRKKMKGKIKALASEARASAGIIGALPFAVMILITLASPDYLTPLFTTSSGHVALGIGACMMAIGVFIMTKMVNFDF